MKILPKAKCPKCGGPVTFWDVLSIITPFQSISCVSCGTSIFLKHRWGLTILALVVGLFVVILAALMAGQNLMTNVRVYLWAAGLLMAVEIMITLRVVRKNQLVVRRDD